ncbi:MAG: hypothetical protein PUB32_04595 [Clostridiales bacterium]|nr:hypothetical protein [Clostridiales bacterium]
MRVKLSSLPSPAKTCCISLDRLDGGLNLFEEESRLETDQSPEMKNLIWRDGALASRRGQRLICELEGEGLAAYERFYAGRAVFHAGDSLYAVVLSTGACTKLWEGLEPVAGAFFLYGGRLYYKTRGAYLAISEDLSCAPVEAYTPVTYINADPATGGGDAYQPENRLSPRKTIWYNADGGAAYKLPVCGAEIVSVTVDGGEVAAYSYDAAEGMLTFDTAPAVSDPPVNNTVRVTYSLENGQAYNNIMDCRFAAVYGGETQLCVVMAGSLTQPDAYFWNGGHTAMDPGYFPMEQYNLVGAGISGFGRQQGMLVIFTGSGVGRASFSLVEIDGRERIQMPYVPINSAIGCDMPGSIRLVENNLVFCSSLGGVYRLQSSSAAYENELLHISRNVDGTELRPGLLADAAAGRCASMDDGSRYWLAVNGHVYLWDHSISTPARPSWFLFTNVEAAAFAREGSEICFVTPDGRVCAFSESFSDFGKPIEREYKFPPQAFGGYERLKDVDKVVLTVSSTTDSLLRMEYISDYGARTEPVPIRAYSWRLSPRNLSYRMLSCLRWSRSAVRRPGCRHVHNFSMRLYNNEAGQDLSLLSARIFFRYRSLER